MASKSCACSDCFVLKRNDDGTLQTAVLRNELSLLTKKLMTITINGSPVEVPGDPRVSLLDFLREDLHLFGAKKGCNQGACGACTVLVDVERVLSCLSLAVQCEGRSVTTIEGLAPEGELHPLQKAFVAHDGFQCGYCTPGQICSAVGMLDEVAKGWPSHVSESLSDIELTGEEISERMSGNLCRCSAYPNIVDAIKEVAEA